MAELDPILVEDPNCAETYINPPANRAAASFAELVFSLWQHWQSDLERHDIPTDCQGIDHAFIEQLKIHIWG